MSAIMPKMKKHPETTYNNRLIFVEIFLSALKNMYPAMKTKKSSIYPYHAVSKS